MPTFREPALRVACFTWWTKTRKTAASFELALGGRGSGVRLLWITGEAMASAQLGG